MSLILELQNFRPSTPPPTPPWKFQNTSLFAVTEDVHDQDDVVEFTELECYLCCVHIQL